jgi:hypothetical protein
MNIKHLLLTGLVCTAMASQAQYVSINALNTAITQDFNTLDTTSGSTTLSTVPAGWWISEAPGNTLYRAGNGSANAGDTYSYGTNGQADRALGSLASGSVTSNFGSRYINHSGSTITSFTMSFTMEQWRSGGRTGLDSLYFFYAINNSIDSAGIPRVVTGNWTRVPACDVVSKVTQGTAAALDGNLDDNKHAYNLTVPGITLNEGDTLWLRWRDPNVAGSDDGLAIDDFSFTAAAASVVTPPAPVTALTVTPVSGTSAQVTFTQNVAYDNGQMNVVVFMKAATPVTLGLPDIAWTNYTASADFSAPGTAYQHDPAAYCIYNGDGNSVTVTGLVPGTTYLVAAYVVSDADSLYSPVAVGSGKVPFPVPPVYTIGQISTVDASGNPDSLNVRVTLRGVVYGFDQLVSSNGVQFVLNDGTGGTTVYSPSNTFGYTVTEGDSIEVRGQVTSYRGLHETDRLDTIIVLGTGTVKAPQLVTALGEHTENNLVMLKGVKFLHTKTGTWSTAGTSANDSALTAAGDTIIIRTLGTSGLAGKPIPATPTFDIIGLGSQFSTTPASFNGYQIYPRTENDIIEIPVVAPDSLTSFGLLTPGDNDTVTVTATNMTDSVNITWEASINSNGTSLTTYTFELDTLGGDFNDLLIGIPVATSTKLGLTKADIYMLMLSANIGTGTTFAGSWRIKAESDGLEKYSSSTYSIYLVNEVPATGLKETFADRIALYPNPASDYTMIKGLSANDQVTVTDLSGRTIYTAAAQHSELNIPVAGFEAGIYFVQVRSGAASAVKKLVIR